MNDLSSARRDWAAAPAWQPPSSDVRLIAFYLPHFYPTEETDRWWGEGFTDWHNVARGQALFDGHYQPRLPRELGFYDLRVDEVRRAQVELARAHGIHAFCFHFYWFQGRRILERPLGRYIADTELDFPFCICWTNENWTRRWDGGSDEVLLAQEHDLASDLKFIREVIPLFKDPRYLRVDGMPLLVLYRADLLKSAPQTANEWRKACQEAGLPGIHLCAAQSYDTADPRKLGFDSACELPPHQYGVALIAQTMPELPADFRGSVFDYEMAARQSLTRPPPDYPLFRTLFPDWDNSPRRGLGAVIFRNSTPAHYEYWLRGLVDYTRRNMAGDQRIIFVNAWNNWAEGAHLEADLKHGTEYLEATKRALAGETDAQQLVAMLRDEARTIDDANLRGRIESYAREIGAHLDHLARTVEFFTEERAMVERFERERQAAVFHRLALDGLFGATPSGDIEFVPEAINGIPMRRHDMIVDVNNSAQITGWMVCRELAPEAETTARFILLKNVEDGAVYAAQFFQHTPRQDVTTARPDIEPAFTLHCGFELLFVLSRVPGDIYQLGCGIAGAGKSACVWSDYRVRLVE